MTTSPGQVTSGKEVIHVMSPVNVAGCKMWSNLMAMRILRHGAFSYAELLDAQLHRLVRKDKLPPGMKAAVLDRFVGARMAAKLELQQAYESIGTRAAWVDADLGATCAWLQAFTPT